MGLVLQKKLAKGLNVTVSESGPRLTARLPTGVYVSLGKKGPFVSAKIGNAIVNSKGGVSVNLGDGLHYHTNVKKLANPKTK